MARSDPNNLPPIRIISGPSELRKGIDDASLSGMSSLFSAASVAVDLIPHDRGELLNFLRFRSAIAQKAASRSGNIFGTFYNRFSGEDPNYVELSGVHLAQTLSVIGMAAPAFVAPRGNYKLRLDIVLEAVEKLGETQARQA